MICQSEDDSVSLAATLRQLAEHCEAEAFAHATQIQRRMGAPPPADEVAMAYDRM